MDPAAEPLAVGDREGGMDPAAEPLAVGDREGGMDRRDPLFQVFPSCNGPLFPLVFPVE
jgi:hypothetical protein